MNDSILNRLVLAMAVCVFGFLCSGCVTDGCVTDYCQRQQLPSAQQQVQVTAVRKQLPVEQRNTTITNNNTTTTDVVASRYAYVANSYNLLPFNQVVADGNFVLEITDGSGASAASSRSYGAYGASRLVIAGRKQDVDDLVIKVENNTLYLSNASIRSDWRWNSSSSFSSSSSTASVTSALPLVMKLRVNNFGLRLQSIVAKGSVQVLSDNLNSKNLTVAAHDKAAITLNGRLNLAKIVQMGIGRIDIKWIDSKNLLVLSKSRGVIYLAGVVDNLTSILKRDAYLDSRYLRARRASVYATDDVIANVLALKSLEIYAEKRSNVFYYKRPKQLNVVNRQSGNALLIEELQ